MGRRLVLDAGALIGLERGSEMTVALAEYADAHGSGVVIPAGVLGQVWRGGPGAARLAKLLDVVEVDALDESRAREVGVRLGERGGRDVVDAHAVCCGVDREAVILTSDAHDLEMLIAPGENVRLLPV